jgi:hypothetical protein
MLQSTRNYDFYTLRSVGPNRQSISFSPDSEVRIGPYAGWKWVFLGYTFSLKNIDFGSDRRGLDLSVYSSQIGIDLFYRNTGDDYKIRSVTIGKETVRPKDLSFSGIEVGIKGFNLYYIFNHHKFSYPAAFSQSTIQKRSCGSPLLGVSYTNHSLKLDYDMLHDAMEQMYDDYDKEKVDSGLMFNRVDYDDYSISGGYAYNYVVTRNLLLSPSLSVALAYKKTVGEMESRSLHLRDFSFSNFNLTVKKFNFLIKFIFFNTYHNKYHPKWILLVYHKNFVKFLNHVAALKLIF